MSLLFENLIRWLSPIIPFTTEEAWQSWREEIDDAADLSCHLLRNHELPSNWNDKKLETNWKKILELREAFVFFHEKMRNAKQVKSTMEAEVCFFFKEKTFFFKPNSLQGRSSTSSALRASPASQQDSFVCTSFPCRPNVGTCFRPHPKQGSV